MARTALGVLTTESFQDSYITQVDSNGVGNGNIYVYTIETSDPLSQIQNLVFGGVLAVGDTITTTIESVVITYTVRDEDLQDSSGSAVTGDSLIARQNVATQIAARINANATLSEIAEVDAALEATLGAVQLTARRPGVPYSAFISITSATATAQVETVEANDIGRTAFITASNGSILNAAGLDENGDRISNVSGGRAYLVARYNIGEIDNPIFSRIGVLQGKSTEENTYLANSGDLEVQAFGDAAAAGMFAGGEVIVSASSPVNITSSVDAVGDIHYLSLIHI